MSITRDEIRALCAAHDRFMAEQACEPIRRPPVSETGDAGVIYKDYDNTALAAAAEPEPEAFDAEASTAPNFFDDVERNEEFADTIAIVIAELRREWKRDIERLERRILRVAKSGVIDLPDWRSRRDVA
jgi:hypothetical protein